MHLFGYDSFLVCPFQWKVIASSYSCFQFEIPCFSIISQVFTYKGVRLILQKFKFFVKNNIFLMIWLASLYYFPLWFFFIWKKKLFIWNMVCYVVFFPWSYVFLNICFCHKRGSITLIIKNSSILTYDRINFGTIWVRGTIWDQL